jgi:integration host factor subunit beta
MSTTTTRKQLAKAVSDRCHLPATTVDAIIFTFLDEIARAFEKGGDTVALRGFGAFSRRERKAYDTVDPRNGEAQNIPATTTITFRPSKELTGRMKG